MTLAQFTLPPDTRAVGTGNPPADMNGVTDAHNAMGAAYNVLNTAYAGGADPTGTNDSTTAINDAITAVESAGGTVFIPPGLYKISGALNLASGVVLQGYGQNATVIQQTSTTAPGFTSAGARYCGIRDLMIEGPNSGSGIGIYFNYSSGPAVAHIDLRNLRVYQFGGAGVNLQTPIVCTVTNVRSESNGGNGFTAANGTSIKWDACYATGNGGNGYEFDTMTYYAAQGCAADSNSGIAYLVSGGGNGGFLGCGGESNTGNGFEITGSACVTLASCYISGNNAIAFWVTGSSSQIMLMGPRETTPTGSATASVQVDAGSNAVLMTPTYTTATNLHANTTANITPQGITAPGVGGTGSMAADRGSTSNFSTFQLNTTGAEIWSWGMKNDSTNDMHLRDADRGLEVLHVQERATMNNFGWLGQPSSYGGGIGIGFLANCNTAPSSNPSGGGFFYASGGALYWLGSSGTSTMIASA